MKNRSLTLVCGLLLLHIVLFAQSNKKNVEFLETCMEEALRDKSHDPSTWYHCEVDKKATLDDLQSLKYSLEKRYVFGSYDYKEGSVKNSGKWKLLFFEFYPIKKMPEMVYSKWKPFDVPFSDLENSGMVWVYFGDDLINRTRERLYKRETNLIPSKDLFFLVKNVKWSGNVNKNGFIDGEGTGFAFYDGKAEKWVSFKGRFKNGFPIGHSSFKFFDGDHLVMAQSGEVSFSLSDFTYSNKAVLCGANGTKIAMIDTYGRGSLMPDKEFEYYKIFAVNDLKEFYNTNEDISKLSRDKLENLEKMYILQHSPRDLVWLEYLPSKRYQDKKVFEDKVGVWSDLLIKECESGIRSGKPQHFSSTVHRVEGFIAPTLINRTKYATHWRESIKQLKEKDKMDLDIISLLLDVEDGLYLTTESMVKTYDQMLYARPILPFVPSVFACIAKSNYWNVLEQAVSSAEKLKNLRPDLKSVLIKSQQTLNGWLKDSRARFSKAEQWQAQKNKEDRESYEAYKADMCDKCKIDGSQTTFPQGYAEGWSFLFFSTPGESKEKGLIVMKNGDKIKWKYLFYDDGSIGIETSGSYSGNYDSVDEMMESIVKECKSRYCH